MDGRKKSINAVGTLFYAKSTGRVLYLLRNARDQVWCLPGGKIERGETLIEAIQRECLEEIGFIPDGKLIPLDCYRSNDDRFVYNTFFYLTGNEFFPLLNDEHIAYAWCTCGSYPKPLHTGLYNTVNSPIIQQKISMILDTLK
jgi:8-oxo-dGTP pyrophosphatase MutT (NUDIX family)